MTTPVGPRRQSIGERERVRAVPARMGRVTGPAQAEEKRIGGRRARVRTVLVSGPRGRGEEGNVGPRHRPEVGVRKIEPEAIFHLWDSFCFSQIKFPSHLNGFEFGFIKDLYGGWFT